jgi:hypothetical protein
MSDEIRVVKSQILTSDEVAKLDGAVLLDPDYLDAAIIGITQIQDVGYVAVYEYEKVVEIYAKFAFGDKSVDEDEETDMSDPYEIAAEWVNYNTIRSLPYAGSRAPKIVVDADMCDESDVEVVYVIKGARYIDA